MNNTATINGLLDGISILENDKNEQLSDQTDLLYSDKEPVCFNLQGPYYDESFVVSDYRVEDFGEHITLLSTFTTEKPC